MAVSVQTNRGFWSAMNIAAASPFYSVPR
jgi:hypothetical protein